MRASLQGRRAYRLSAFVASLGGAAILLGSAASPAGAQAAARHVLLVTTRMSASPMTGSAGTKIVLRFRFTHTNLREVASGAVRFGSVVARRWGALSADSAWVIVPPGAPSTKITLSLPANTIPEDGPLHPAENAVTSGVFMT